MVSCTFEKRKGPLERVLRSVNHAQARNKTEHTAWGNHMRIHDKDFKIDNSVLHKASIFARPGDDVTRKTREAIEVRDRKPIVNKTSGWQIV